MISLRRAGAGDAAKLSLAGCATFLDTYAEFIPGDDMVAHCARTHSAAVYETWLADPLCALWICETATGAPIGYCVMIPASLPHDAQHASDLEILRIYVLSRYHGEGLGHRLMNAALAEAHARGARHLVLGMLKKNARALAFYERQRFAVVSTRIFHVGESVMDDLVLVRGLD